MIPKVIHYCWFGRGEKSKLIIKCISSWKKFCPDYEIKEWNEDNFDVYQNSFTKQAYEQKKWAFVADYARCKILFVYGGIYLDSDVEVVQSFDNLLNDTSFTCCERTFTEEATLNIEAGVMGAIPKLFLFKEMLDYYEKRNFIDEKGLLDMLPIPQIMRKICLQHGGKLTNDAQTIDNLHIYTNDYFSPYDNASGRLYKTKNTYSIHWFNKSWLPKATVLKSKITRVFHRLFGNDCFKWLKKKK